MINYGLVGALLYWYSTVILLLSFFIYLYVYYDEVEELKRDDWFWVLFMVLFVVPIPLLFVEVFYSYSYSVPTVSICDHYVVDGSKKFCVPVDEFSLPASYLDKTKMVAPSGEVYTEEGKEIGKVRIFVKSEGVENCPDCQVETKLIVKLPASTKEKLKKLLEKKSGGLFYLDIYSKKKMWKVVPFRIFKEEKK